MSDIKDIFAEAKSSGFDPKTMRQIIRIRAMDEDVLAEQETLLDTYREALGIALASWHELDLQPA